MTLLQEYQALPDKKLNYNNIGRMYEAMGEENPRAEAIEKHIDTAHTVVRLLCRALRESLYTITPDIGTLDALLTAIERDFPEGA